MAEVGRARVSVKIDKRRLRWILGIFFAALVVPTAVLVYQAFGQLKWEAFYQHRVLAEELADRIDQRLRAIIDVEEARSLSDYGFLVVEGESAANFVQRSPLASFPVDPTLPGLLAYFQIDSRGAFSTPLLPVGVDAATYGVSTQDLTQRRALEAQVRELLIAGGEAVAAKPRAPEEAVAKRLEAASSNAPEAVAATLPERDVREFAPKEKKDNDSQAVFDRLDEPSGAKAMDASAQLDKNVLGKIADLKLESGYAARSDDSEMRQRDQALAKQGARVGRKERTLVSPLQAVTNTPKAASGGMVRTFESELDPFAFRRLDAGHFVLFRKVALNGERLIQGAVIAQDKFIEGIIVAPFRDTTLSNMSDLIVGYQGEVVGAFDGRRAGDYTSVGAMTGELLYRRALSVPLHDFELIFTITQLPVGPGGRVIGWVTLVLALVLAAGFWVVYRFGVGQIDLSLQQQDFVSAVSHELKTPLTSIRMYGEILRAGWADEAKKQSYYDFIYFESERLSRLINNVLRLARLTRNGDELDRKPIKAAELLSLVESKVVTQVEQAGYTLDIDRTPIAGDPSILVDADSLVQILINLVDNAVKFSSHASNKVVELGCRAQPDGGALFWVRDYGPGVAKDQMKKIFKLFYRAEGELTRETVGTGIGLALVHQLTSAMGGVVRVRNCDPGAEFSVAFPAVDGAP